MARTGGFCLNRIKPQVKVRSPGAQPRPEAKESPKYGKESENLENSSEEKPKAEESKPGLENGRKVMIVVDLSSEAKNALQWALSHCIQDEDNIVLLYVTKPPKVQAPAEESTRERTSRAYEQVHPLKNMCQLKKPDVKTEIVVVEGEEKGRTIVEESKKQGAGMLVLGQKRRSMKWRMIMIWAGNRAGGNTAVVDYCIQNAECMAVAVRKKSKKLGGYLITTKRHKDFWLLA